MVSVAPLGSETVRYALLCISLVLIGWFAGVFAVPPQVFIQTRPPADAKGRVIGAMNLINWIGISLAAIWYFVLSSLMAAVNIPASWLFLSVGLLFVIAVLLFRQPNPPLADSN